MIIIGIMTVLVLSGCTKNPSEENPSQETPKPPLSEPTVVKDWEPEPIPSDSKTIAINDLGKFMGHIQSKLEKNKKGEFETTTDFKKRSSDVNVMIAPIKREEIYAFVPQYADMKYDADKAVFVPVTLALTCNNIYPIDAGIACQIGVVTETESNLEHNYLYNPLAPIIQSSCIGCHSGGGC